MKLSDFALAIAFLLLCFVFFTGLPPLRGCPLVVELSDPDAKKGFKSKIPILLITLVYSVTAFINLGNTTAPQSFLPLSEAVLTLELEGTAIPKTAALYSGVGTGAYNFEWSIDGEEYYSLTEFQQSHDKVLKWHYLNFDPGQAPRYIRISCTSGSPWLGEIAFFDENGYHIPATSFAAALCDEADTVPPSSHFMNSTHFDEVYHARTAWEHLNNVWPYEISHPPLGKLLIALGVSLFGMTPFGWRFMGTLFGCLMLPLMYALIKRILKFEKVAILGTIVFAADFMHFTQTRIATIDTYAVFFILLMYYFMYIFISEDDWKALALSGVAFGLGAASKWTCLYAGAGLAVIWLYHWYLKLLHERCFLDFGRNVLYCLAFFVLIPCLIYYLSYIPYGTAEGYAPFSSRYTEIVIENQKFMFTYHVGVNAEHPYSSRWYQWILNIRPILYYLEYYDNGTRSSIAAFLNPVTCWFGILSMAVVAYTSHFRGDTRATFIIVGFLAQLLPWLLVERLTFEYHYFPCSVFLVLAIAYVFEVFRVSRLDWLRWCIPVAVVSVLLFILFYPVLSGHPVNPYFSDRWLQWLPSWPI